MWQGMTETEWTGCSDLKAMLEHLDLMATDRQFRFFAAACCRRLWQMLIDPRSRNAIELAEQQADGFAGRSRLDDAYMAALLVIPVENRRGQCAASQRHLIRQ